MAVSAAAVHTSPGRFEQSYDVTATADGDTGMVLSHSIPNILSANEVKVTFEPLNSVSCALSAWSVTARGLGDVTLTKANAVGSGNGAAQVRVRIERRHGMVR